MNVVALLEASYLPRDLDVVSVVFTPKATHVDLQSQSTGKTWRVRFLGAEGLRVLDESDLLEFWPQCSTPNGTIFRIESNGWFEQESQRQGFLKRDTQPHMPEYFITGENACVNVFSHVPPELCELPQAASETQTNGVHGAA